MFLQKKLYYLLWKFVHTIFFQCLKNIYSTWQPPGGRLRLEVTGETTVTIVPHSPLLGVGHLDKPDKSSLPSSQTKKSLTIKNSLEK